MDHIEYIEFTEVIRQTKDVVVKDLCNGYTARNIGDVKALVNQKRLLPFPPGHPELSGESFSVGGNLGEIYSGIIVVQFLAGAGTNPAIEITQKIYRCKD